MLCEECKKRPATVHFTKIVGDQKTEFHLCQQCAAQRGELGFLGNIQINFPNILSSFFDLDQKLQVDGDWQEDTQARCPSCGLSYGDFRELGQLGCSDCYKTFGAQMEPILRRIHGHTRHTGKIPRKHAGKLSQERELENYKAQLKEAIAREEYEQAAKLRDKIHALEKELGGGRRG
jgi:protein arginine kinase activator